MKIQSSHSTADRGHDAYFTPIEAVRALLAIEAGKIPKRIWEPACGDGAIVTPLADAGFNVIASDIADYGFQKSQTGIDYLRTAPIGKPEGVITNPPYRLAMEFVEKATSEAPYVAMLLRTNFLESVKRKRLFEENPLARVWVPSRRLPMMHRHGWSGTRAPSNTCFAWFVWDQSATTKAQLCWFDWADHA